MLSKSAYLLVYQAALIWGLTLVPEDWTKWDKDHSEFKHWFHNWAKNVHSKPVIDHDPFLVNYVGHPVSGMGYYVMARQTGYGPWGAFLYGLFESTVIWEYGVEAFVENPSVQDLLVTPTLGAIFGEISYRLIQDIENSDGELYGSKKWGYVATTLLSPFNSLTVWTRQKLRNGDYYTPKVQSTWMIQPTGRHHGQQMVLSWAMQF